MKGSGKPDDRKGQVRFDAAGAGDGFTVRLVRHRQTKETGTDRLHLRDTAPVLDPTAYLKNAKSDFLYERRVSRVRQV
jgi:hypothetical protein